MLADVNLSGAWQGVNHVTLATRRMMFAVVALIAGTTVCAQASSGPVVSELQADYRTVADYVVRAAEKMPDAEYGFKPSADVRSFAQQIAHIADDQYNLCAPAKGETRKAAYRAIESSLSTKAELVPALRAAVAYCDSVYNALTDATGAEMVTTGQNRTKFGMLNWNVWHTWEHYGNIVVYLRMKGIVPPSSEKKPGMD